MKKIAIIGLIAAILIAGGLLLRYHDEMTGERDKIFRERLVGVWVRSEDDLPPGVWKPLSMRCTNTVAADGSFIERSWFRHSDRTNTYQRTGTWFVRNDRLLETIKTSTNPTEVTPSTNTMRIVRADASGFTVRWPNSQVTVWQKVTQRSPIPTGN